MVEKEKIIDKKFIPTLIALGILLVLTFIALPLFKKNNLTTPVEEKFLLKLKPNEVNYLLIETPNNSVINTELTLDKNGQWKVNGYEAYEPDVNKILLILSKIRILSVIRDYAYLQEFGLDPAQKIVTIGFNDKNKQKIRLLVGDYSPAAKDRYAKFANKPEIYIADKYLYDNLTVTPQGLLNKDVFGIDGEKLVRLEVTRLGATYKLEKIKNEWFVTLPNKIRVYADQSAVNNVISSAFGNMAEGVIAHKTPDLKKYNLKDPWITVKAEDKDGNTEKVLVSSNIPSTFMYYALNVKKNKVFLMHKNNVISLDFNELDIRNKMIIVPQLSEIAQMIITVNDKKYTFIKPKDKMWECKNLKMEQILINQYVEDLSKLYVDITSNLTIAETGENFGFDKPNVRIEAFVKGKENISSYKPYTVNIGKKSKEGYYYLEMSNDPYVHFIKQDTYNFISKFGLK